MDGFGSLAGTLTVVFIRREYGDVRAYRTIVDIGANMGSFAVYAALNSPESRIYCYEPEEGNFQVLKQNIQINGLEQRVFLFEYAVGAHEGHRDIVLREAAEHSFYAEGTAGRTQTVRCTTLPKIFEFQDLDQIDLLKVNCEGAEYEIFEGCEPDHYGRILNITMEYHNMSTERNGRRLTELLRSKGYRIRRFSKYRGVSGFIWATRDE
jgi:FkbM family methyltransferase